MNEELPNRRSIRRRGWDYTAPGLYFITINTRGNRPFFGTVVNGRTVVSAAGRVAEEEWHRSAEIRDSIELDEFVVMPNHVHGIVRLTGRPAGRPLTDGRPADGPPDHVPDGRPAGRPFGARLLAESLGAFIAGYKGAVGRRINAMQGTPGAAIWHRNYWDVIVRDDRSLANIRHYIRINPRSWQAVEQAGEPRFLGNRALLDGPTVGFLASRGPPGLHGTLPLRPGEAIMSGFLSPMERAVFRAGLAGRRPLIWVKPSGRQEGTDTPAIRRALEDGRLLVVSPFADAIEASSVRRAAWCNQYVLARATRVIIGHLDPGGLVECLLTEADPDADIAYL